MTGWLIAAGVWVGIAVLVALVVCRAIRIADREEHTDA